jgi:dynein heavy chain
LELKGLVEDLSKRVKSAQKNVEKIHSIMEPWLKTPLIERKERKKTTLLSLEDRKEKVSKRYAEIRQGAEQIQLLLTENKKFFEISEDDSDAWQAYVTYVDKIIIESLRKAVGCSLSYLTENMDPMNQNEPLLEAHLELREPDLYYVPSLEPDDTDGLDQLMNTLLNDIIGMASLVPRLKSNIEGYAEELEKNDDIRSMKIEILTGVNKAIEEASDFCGIFEGKEFKNILFTLQLNKAFLHFYIIYFCKIGYAYLWLEDREITMQQFLNYSRQLSIEEMDMITVLDPKSPKICPPKMEQFREQIDLYESLYTEVEEMSTSKIFSVWFRVNLKPFRQSLLNTICKWSSMFKKHLMERVITSLSDLGTFIR